MALLLIYLMVEWGRLMFAQEEFLVSITKRENAFGWVAIVTITYLSYRFFGMPMLVVLLLSAAYLLLPSSLLGAGVGWMHSVENLCSPPTACSAARWRWSAVPCWSSSFSGRFCSSPARARSCCAWPWR